MLTTALDKANFSALDTETYGFGPRSKGNVRVMSIACLNGRDIESFVIDVNDHPDLDALLAVLAGREFYGWNANFDAHVLDNLFGGDTRIKWWDGMIADALLYQGMHGFKFYHSLAWASDRYLGTTLTGKGTTQTSFTKDDPLTEEQVRYAAEDAVSTVRVCAHLKKALRSAGLEFAAELEFGARPFLDHMERCGIALDWDGWSKVLAEKELRLKDKLSSEIAELMGVGQPTLFGGLEPVINPASTADLKFALNDVAPEAVMQYTLQEYGHKRLLQASDKLDTLALKQIDHPLAKAILRFKEDKKVLSTYGANLKKHLWDDGRMRPSYMQVVGTGTGRLSSRNPNAQNLTPLLKPYFKPPNGRVFVYADLSQAELRFLAELSQDETMRRAFREERDIHEATAEAMLGVDMVALKESDPKQYKEMRAIGKAQPLYSKILTPSGWTTMGELHVGDRVVGSDGKSTTVTGIFPQGELMSYRMTFDDGSTTECSEDHLWVCSRATHDVKGPYTLTLRQIMDEGVENDWRPGLRKFRWQFPLAQPWVGEYKHLPVDPYTLGALLGDGSLSPKSISIYCADREISDRLAASLPEGNNLAEVGANSQNHFYVRGGHRGKTVNPIFEKLDALGLLGTKSATKFIPKVYLEASLQQRLDLLHGLMDTDGSASGNTSFTSVSEQLARDVAYLVRSLGGAAYVNKGPVPKGGNYHPWRVSITLPSNLNPFYLPRKAQTHRTTLQARRLVSVEPVGKTDMQCISVDANDSLYITDDFVLTHNTLNFSIVYGLGGRTLAKRLTVDRREAARNEGLPTEEVNAIEVTPEEGFELIEAYRAGYPLVAAWLDDRARIVSHAVATLPEIDWRTSVKLYETLREIGYAPTRYQKQFGHRPDGRQLAEFVDQYSRGADLREKARRFDWAMKFEAAVVLENVDTPYTLYSHTDSGRRRHFNIPMDRIYETCIQLMLRSDKPDTVKTIVDTAARFGATLSPSMSNDEIFEVFKGRGKNAPSMKVIVEACGEGRKPWVLDDLMTRALANRVGALTNAVKNNPIQGGVGDAVLLGYALAWQRILDSGLQDVYPVQTVHDSVTLECNEADAEAVCQILQSALEDGFARFCPNVPAKADASVLTSLDEADRWAGTGTEQFDKI